MVTDRIQSKQILHSLIIDAIEMKAELKIIIFNSRVLASTETTGFCVLMKTLTSSDRKGGWPLVLTEIFQKLKGVLNTQIFQIQGLSMYAREEKLHRRRRLKLGGWGYAPPDFAILRHKYWNFCRWGADVPPDETSLATRSKEKRLYSQAWIIENFLPLTAANLHVFNY